MTKKELIKEYEEKIDYEKSMLEKNRNDLEQFDIHYIEMFINQFLKVLEDIKNLNEEPVSDKVLIDFRKWAEANCDYGIDDIVIGAVDAYEKSINSAERILP